MLGDFTTTLVVYVALYSLAFSSAIALTAKHKRLGSGSVNMGLAVFIFALGFPPSPLFFFKLSLGGFCATLFGASFTIIFGLLLFASWFRFIVLVPSLKLKTPTHQSPKNAIGGLSGAQLTSLLALAALVTLACTPFGFTLFGIV
jgi:hypothetical protein